MSKIKALIISAVAAYSGIGISQAFTISFNSLAPTSPNFMTSSGAALDEGSFVRLGYFDDPVGNAALLRTRNYAAIEQLFIPFGEGGNLGTGAPITVRSVPAGAVGGSASNVTFGAVPAGTNVYVLAVNQASTDLLPTTEFGLFNDPAWVLPKESFDDLVMTSAQIDEAGESLSGGSLDGGLGLVAAAVPEPSVMGLLALAGLGLIVRRRR